MNNTIFLKQNRADNQRLIITQHFVYKNAKTLAFFLFIISVIIPIGFNITLILINNEIISAIFSFISICLVVLCEMMRNSLENKKCIAAQVQQKFDCNVFELNNVFCLDEETIDVVIEKYKTKDWNRKKNWYPDYRIIDKNSAIYYCQRENVDWTDNLTKKYLVFLKICLVVMVISLVINFIMIDDSVLHIISIFVITLPFITYCYSGFSKIKNDNKVLNEIKKYANIIDILINENETIDEKFLINMQWMIFYYRKNKYLIPDWFYNLFYKRIEQQELNKAVKRKKKKMNKDY